MRVLVIGHAYISPINREKWQVFSKKYSDIQIKILIPKFWPATLFEIEAGNLSGYNSENCEFVSFKTFKSGNEVLYGYNFFNMINLIKNFNPDLIHVEQGDNAFSYFQAILLAKIFCKKTKFIFFTWVNWEEKRSWKYKLFWKIIEKFNLFFSNGAIVGNSDAKSILRKKGFRPPVEVLLQLGVNKKRFKQIFEKSLEKQDKKYIGFIGRIVREKGIFNLVDAFAMLYKKFRNWNLLFVGDGVNKKELLEYVHKNNLEDRIEFRKSVAHEQVYKILNELDIFVLPSYDTPNWREQFGHVLIEAMFCKIPIIGSDAGEIPNVIKDAGLIFKQKNVNELFICLKKLIEDRDLRQELKQKGYKHFCKNYSYEIIAEKTYNFWKKFV